MRYVYPEKVVRGHAKKNKIPKWDIAIMCFHSIEKTRYIVNELGGICLKYRLFSKCNENMVFETKIEGKKVGILGWCTGGGPLVASLIEELKVTGVKWIIGIGSAASIRNNIKKNEIIIPEKLIVNDGLSRWYTQKKIMTLDKVMDSIINRVIQQCDISYRRVFGATIEALYRQDENMLNPLRELGAEVVNWELTPFYSVTEFNNIHSVWVGHVSDIECDGVWDDWYADRTEPFKLCIMLCKRLVVQIVRDKKDENKFEDYNPVSS